MKLINNAVRLITIKFKGVKYPLMPAGEAVEVPDEAATESPFVASLIEDGSVKIVSSEADDSDLEAEAEAERLEAERIEAERAEADRLEQERLAAEEAEKATSEAALHGLREEAASLGVSVDNRWGEARLKEEIEKALSE